MYIVLIVRIDCYDAVYYDFILMRMRTNAYSLVDNETQNALFPAVIAGSAASFEENRRILGDGQPPFSCR